MKKLLISVLLLAFILPVFGQQNVDEFKFSLVPRRVAVPSLTGYLRADSTVPLTANWPMGAFTLSQATWQGVAVAAGYGGTGLASYAVGDILYASGATALSKLAAVATGQVLVSAGTTTAPAWSGNPSVASLILTGTGTLASTAGNASFTTTLSAATGDEVGFSLLPTINKASSGNYTAFKVNATETSAPGTGDLLLDLQVGTASKLNVSNGGVIYGTNIAYNSPTFAALAYPTSGLAITSAGAYLVHAGTAFLYGGTGGVYCSYSLNLMGIALIGAANELQLSADAASPVAQTIKAHDATVGGANNIAGANISVNGGRGVGTGIGGSVYLATAPAAAGSANTPLNSYVNVLEADSTGTIKHLGAQSQATNIKQATVVVTTTAAATATATNLIPAGSMVVGVTTRVTTAVTGDAGFTGFNIGDGTDVDRWGANVTPTLNETTDLTDCTVTTPPIYASATSVVLTQVGGTTFSAGGVVRITVHYLSLTAPAS